jgi:hypothetical protein
MGWSDHKRDGYEGWFVGMGLRDGFEGLLEIVLRDSLDWMDE